jgi:methionine aminopeptidase
MRAWLLAIEPMINMGTKEVKQLNDGWTVVSRDGKPSAHFEHTIVVRPAKQRSYQRSNTSRMCWCRKANL